MMRNFLAALAIASAPPLHAEDFLPELAPFVTKYKSDTAALTIQEVAAMEKPRQAYLAALASAETTSTKSGQVPVVAAIAKEREYLDKGVISAEPPEDFPKKVLPERKSYITSLGRITTDFAARQQRINSDYLKTLASLQSRAGGNPALAQQIATQKNLLLGTSGGGSLTIISATFQGAGGENPKDVLPLFKKIMESGEPTTKCTPAAMKTDPHPYHAKVLILEYVAGGVAKKKKFSEGETVTFKELLK